MAGTVVFVAIFFFSLLAILFVLNVHSKWLWDLGKLYFVMCYTFVALSALNEEMDMYQRWLERKRLLIVGTAKAAKSVSYI